MFFLSSMLASTQAHSPSSGCESMLLALALCTQLLCFYSSTGIYLHIICIEYSGFSQVPKSNFVCFHDAGVPAQTGHRQYSLTKLFIKISGYPEVRISGFPDIRISGYPDIRLSGQPEFRKSGFPAFRISGNPAFRKAGIPEM